MPMPIDSVGRWNQINQLGDHYSIPGEENKKNRLTGKR